VTLAYPALHWRIFRRMRRHGFSRPDAALYAAGRIVGKFPQLHGVLSMSSSLWSERLSKPCSLWFPLPGGNQGRNRSGQRKGAP
jgi:hypothetical protein